MSISTNSRIIAIVGPTASGKSKLAVSIAKEFNGEIISADARQVYRGLDIGTGKITKKEMAGIPHHLLNMTSPKRTFSAAAYQRLAQKAARNILRHGKIPIFCGGTGFYIRAALDGLIIPEVKPNQKLRITLERLETKELFRLLQKRDEKRAETIDSYNRRRLIRALEITESLGKIPPLKAKPLSTNILAIGIKKTKEELKKLIHERLLKRLQQGLIQEVRKLHAHGLSWKRLEDLGLEYRCIAKFLQGKMRKENVIPLLEKDIEHYAKRQMTWFKRDKRIYWIQNKKEALNLTKNFLANKSR